MINGAIRRALQVAKMRKEQPQQSSGPAPQQAPVPRMKDMPVDPTRSKSAQERQKFQEGGSIKYALAKALDLTHPKRFYNTLTPPGYARGGEVWDKPRPKNLGKPKSLSATQKKAAKASAKASGRPWPNLIDSMNAAKKK